MNAIASFIVEAVDIEKSLKYCLHCAEELEDELSTGLEVQSNFCCNGCEQVYKLLDTENLSQKYYGLLKNNGEAKRLSLKNYQFQKFTELDSKQLINELPGEDRKQAEFYLEGVHCVACLWLVEKLSDILNGIIEIRLNLGTSIVKIDFDPKLLKLSEVASKLQELGYPPHLIENANIEKAQIKESHKKLLEIGVAGFCAGNIMLFSSSIYSGADAEFESLFLWASGLFFMPILLFSAKNILLSSYQALRQRTINLDIPISFSLLLGSLLSYLQLFKESPVVYFDSLSALVFLILFSRYWLKELVNKNLKRSHIQTSLENKKIRKLVEGKIIDCHINELKPNEVVCFEPGEMLLVDGILLNDGSYFNTSNLTGEYKGKYFQAGSKLYAGYYIIDKKVEILVTGISKHTKLGKIYEQINYINKKDSFKQIEQWSKLFVLLSFAGSVLSFIYYFNHIEAAITRALAFSIITCPCALGLAAPFLLRNTIKFLSEQAIVLKNFSSLELLFSAKDYFFDKTGTLTYGKFRVLKYKVVCDNDALFAILYKMEKNSEHPVARALVEFLRTGAFALYDIQLEEIKETLGKEVSAKYQKDHYLIRALNNEEIGNFNLASIGTSVGIYKNGNLQAYFVLGDTIKEDALSLVYELRQLGKNIHIISGDKKHNVLELANTLGIEPENILFELSPEQKAQKLKEIKNSVMIGDGANDALAQHTSIVGVSLNSFSGASVKASDINILRPDLKFFLRLVQTAYKSFSYIRIMIFASIVYNIIAGVAAFLGLISPLVAAVLMPLSSTCFIAFSLFAISKIKQQWRGKSL